MESTWGVYEEYMRSIWRVHGEYEYMTIYGGTHINQFGVTEWSADPFSKQSLAASCLTVIQTFNKGSLRTACGLIDKYV